MLQPVEEAGEVVTYDAQGNKAEESCTDCEDTETGSVLTFEEEDELDAEEEIEEEAESAEPEENSEAEGQ